MNYTRVICESEADVLACSLADTGHDDYFLLLSAVLREGGLLEGGKRQGLSAYLWALDLAVRWWRALVGWRISTHVTDGEGRRRAWDFALCWRERSNCVSLSMPTARRICLYLLA